MVAFTCLSCQKKLSVKDELAGKKVKCPGCGQVVAVPASLDNGTQAAPSNFAHTQDLQRVPTDEPGLSAPSQNQATQAPPGHSATGEPPDSAERDPESNLTDFLAPPQAADELGRLGGFRILKVLGHGGMGVVFLGEDPNLGRLVAIKAMLPHVAESKSAQQRFLREARVAATLEHDHIVPIFHVGEDRGAPFIVMPLLKGEPLDGHLKREENVPIATVLRIGREIAEGLAAAHECGLIHRDIKPANIWLEDRGQGTGVRGQEPENKDQPSVTKASSLTPGTRPLAPTYRVKILDFGLARAAAQDSGLTQQGAIIGTPTYMAPEQGRGDTVDARCDLWSLGVVLYYMCTGQIPFKGKDAVSTLMAVAMQDPPPPAKVNAAVPAGLSDLVMQLLNKNPDGRPASAAAVVAALASMEGEVSVRASAMQSRDEKITQDQGTQQLPGQNILPPPRTRRRLAATLAFLGLLIAGGLALYQFIFRTTDGTLIVEVDKDADFRFQKGKLLIYDADGKLRNTVKPSDRTQQMPPGKYTIQVTGADGLKLVAEKFEITPRGKARVRVMVDGAALVTAHGWPEDAPPLAVAPFDAAQARKLQEAWAKYLKMDVEYTNSIGMRFILIPPGEFSMGSEPEEIEDAIKAAIDFKDWQDCIKHEAPKHKVVLTQPLYLGVHEVTQAEYQRVMGKNPSHFSPMGAGKDAVPGLKTAEHPVEMVSWNDAAEFCSKLSELEKLKPFYLRTGEAVTMLNGAGYRLPTEAEWEFACRAGTTTKYWIGNKDEDLVKAAWFSKNSDGKTHKVGELQANPLGLYDVHGNAWEWVQDWWDLTYYEQFKEKPAYNPNGPAAGSTQRFVRGGNLDSIALSCRSSDRSAHDLPTLRLKNLGFRVALVLNVGKKSEIAKIKLNDPERQVAEWLLKRKCQFVVKPTDGKPEVTVTVAEQLPTTPFQVRSITATAAHEAWRNDDLDQLNPLKALQFLHLPWRSEITDAGIERFTQSPSAASFIWLDIQGSEITDAGVAHLRRCPELVNLALGRSKVTDRCLDELRGLGKLQLFRVESPHLTASALDNARLLPNVTDWSIGGPKITDAVFNKLATKKLRSLGLGNSPQVTGRGLGHLNQCTSLKNLGLTSTSVDDAGLAELGRLPELEFLNLGFTKVGDAGLKDWTRFPKLRGLRLEWSQVTNAGLAELKGAGGLETLSLSGPKITDAGLPHLEALTKLQELNLVQAKVTADGVKKLAAALPGCRIEWDGGVLEPKTSSNLERKAAEWVLSVGGKITFRVGDREQEVTASKDLPTGASTVLKIDGSENPRLTDAGLENLAGLKNLNWLNLSRTKLTDAGMAHLKGLTSIENIGLWETDITSAGLEHLAGFKKLKGLGMSHTKITDAGMAHLQALTSLENLGLKVTSITDEGLEPLANLKSLKWVELNNTKVTAAGVKKLSAALPGCKITWDGGVFEPNTSPDLERKAAEWVLLVGGKVGRIEPDGKTYRGFSSAKDFPSGPLLITLVDLNNNPRITNADLERLKPLIHLRDLTLHTLPITDGGLEHLRPLTKLRDLRIVTAPVTNAGLVHLKGLVELHSLALSGTQITDDGFQHLKSLTKLNRYFDLTDTDTGDKVLDLVQAQPHFTIFSAGKNFTDDGLRRLRAMQPGLSQVGLRETKVTDAGLKHLKGWVNLSSLDLSGSSVTNAGLEQLNSLKNLSYVGLAHTKLTDEGIVHFKGWSQITQLDLRQTSITDEGLKHLAGLKNLKGISLKDTKVSGEGVAALHKALPGCQILWDGGLIAPKTPAERPPPQS